MLNKLLRRPQKGNLSRTFSSRYECVVVIVVAESARVNIKGSIAKLIDFALVDVRREILKRGKALKEVRNANVNEALM